MKAIFTILILFFTWFAQAQGTFSGIVGQSVIYSGVGVPGPEGGTYTVASYPTSISVFDTSENLVQQATTDLVGQFTVYLEPGNYVVVPANPLQRSFAFSGDTVYRPAYPFAPAPINITVNFREFTTMTINYFNFPGQ